jgi:hypothetical protein
MPTENTDAAILYTIPSIETQRAFHTWSYSGLYNLEDAVDGGVGEWLDK